MVGGDYAARKLNLERGRGRRTKKEQQIEDEYL